MKKFKLKKKTYVIILVIIILIILFTHKRNYKVEYKINSTSIKEEYNKALKIHYIIVNKNKKNYEFVVENNKGKKIVKNIDYFQKDNISCLNISIKKIKTSPVCYKDNTYIDIHLLNNTEVNDHYNIKEYKEEKIIDNYDNIQIYNYQNANFLLWNYRGFYYLNEDNNKNIKVLDNDVYNLKIVSRLDNLVLMADYNEDYIFNKFIIFNLENGKKEVWNIDYEISMDSYILGKYNKSIYLVDKKNKVEYEIVPYRKRMRIVGNKNKDGIIYQDEFKNVSMNKLTSKELTFTMTNAYNYVIDNNKLYLKLYNSDNKLLINDLENIKIIDQIDDNLHYLSNDILYSYNLYSGSKKLMNYFEWNFNNDNMIFIYK